MPVHMAPQQCPNCGSEVPTGAKACPECGSDETTGWSEKAALSNLGLPEEEFDYGEFVQREFGGKKARPYGINWLWWSVGVGVLLLFLFAGFKWLF